MPVEETTILNITCDNPDCPGNELDPTDRVGWTFVNSEVYGDQISPGGVYCCAMCVSGYVAVLDDKEKDKKEKLEEQAAMEVEAQAAAEAEEAAE